MRDAQADAAGRKQEADGLHPKVEQYGQRLPGLESEYDRRVR